MFWTKRMMMRNQIRKAICEYERMMVGESGNVRRRSKLADLYLKDHRQGRAIEQYVQVARHYEAEDLKTRAISVYRKILSLDPKNVVIYHRMAKLYTDQRLLGNAKTVYQEIIKLCPGDESARKAISQVERTIFEDRRHASESLSVAGSSSPQTVPPVSVMA